MFRRWPGYYLEQCLRWKLREGLVESIEWEWVERSELLGASGREEARILGKEDKNRPLRSLLCFLPP